MNISCIKNKVNRKHFSIHFNLVILNISKHTKMLMVDISRCNRSIFAYFIPHMYIAIRRLISFIPYFNICTCILAFDNYKHYRLYLFLLVYLYVLLHIFHRRQIVVKMLVVNKDTLCNQGLFLILFGKFYRICPGFHF